MKKKIILLTNFTECINKKLKNPKSNLFIVGKREQFWEFLLNKVLIPTSEELIMKITILSMTNNQASLASLPTVNNSNFFSNANAELNNEEKEKLSITLETLLMRIGNLFNEFFFYNYKFLGKYFEELEKIIFYYEEKVQNAGLECIKFLNGSEKMKNMSFLRPFVIFLTKLADKSLEKEFLNIDVHVLRYDSKQYNDIIDLNILYCYIHLNILTLLDKIIEQYIDILGEEDLNKILDSLESSFDISNKFNNKIELRLFQ